MSNLKGFELIFKKIINKLIFKGKAPITIDSPKIIFRGYLKILILRQDRIGDLIISSSIIRILRNKLPEAEIDIILSANNYPAFLCISEFVNNIFIYSKKLIKITGMIKTLRKKQYDLIIDLFDNASTTSSIFVKLIKAKSAIGIDKENKNIYTYIVPLADKRKNHIIDRISMILLPFGVNPREENLTPFYPLNNEKLEKASEEFGKAPGKILVAVNVSGSDRSKFMGRENLRDLISLCQKFLIEVELIIFFTADYSEEINDIAKEHNAMKAPLFNEFDDYANYLAACDIIITPDTSAIHLASAFKKPCIALFKGLDESSDMPWFPYKTKYLSIETKGKTISDIPPIKIFEALKSICEEFLK